MNLQIPLYAVPAVYMPPLFSKLEYRKYPPGSVCEVKLPCEGVRVLHACMGAPNGRACPHTNSEKRTATALCSRSIAD